MTFVFTKLFNLTMKGCHKSKPGNGRQVLTDESYTLKGELCLFPARDIGSGENTRATRRTREGSGALVRILRVSRVYFPALVPSVNSEYQSNYSEKSQQEHALR